MKYVKILFAVALVFTLCSAFSLKKGEHKPVYALEYRRHLPIQWYTTPRFRYSIAWRWIKTDFCRIERYTAIN